MNDLVPIVIDETSRGEHAYDIYSRFGRAFMPAWTRNSTNSSDRRLPTPWLPAGITSARLRRPYKRLGWPVPA